MKVLLPAIALALLLAAGGEQQGKGNGGEQYFHVGILLE